MFERHSKRVPLLTASILCTAFAVSAQEGNRNQDPSRNQDPQALQAAMKDKFAKFEDVKGATVYMKTPSAGGRIGGQAGGQNRGQGNDAAAGGSGSSGEKIGQIVDVIVHTSSDSGNRRIGSPGVTTGMPGLAEAVVKVTASGRDDQGGDQKQGNRDQGRSGLQTGSTSGDRTVRVPLAMFEWNADQNRLSFTRTRAEFDAMPVLVITVTEIEPGATPPGGIGRGQEEQGERGQTGGERGQQGRTDQAGDRNAGQDQTLKLTKASNAQLVSKDDQKLGKCEHVVLDMAQGEAAFVLASLEGGGSGGDLTVIPWRAINEKSSGTAEASGQRGQTGQTGEQKDANKDEEKGEYGEKSGHKSGQKDGSLTLVVDLDAAKLKEAPTMSANDLSKLTDPEFRMKILECFRDFEQPGTGREEQGSGRGR